MSAFIVDYKTIDNILSVRLNSDILTQHCYLKSEFETLFDNYAGYTRDYLIYDNLEALGKEFLRLNIASVNARYPKKKSQWIMQIFINLTALMILASHRL